MLTSTVAPDPSLPVAATTPSAAEPPDGLRWLRRSLWLYLALWVFEGALRKWILPGLANPLLVVRDPVLLLIYVLALSRGVFPKNFLVGWIAVEGIMALAASIVATDTPLAIELYGLRSNFLHLPLIFVIPMVFDGRDLRRVGLAMLTVSLPMSALVLLQFGSRSSSWLNAGAGGSKNGMLGSALGHIRPSGTFSFGNGLGGFTVLVAAFFVWQIFDQSFSHARSGWRRGAALVVLIALSGSRTTAGAVGLVLATVFLVGIVQPRYWSGAVKLLVLVGLGVLLIGSFSVFKEGMGVFASRFGDSSNVQTGFFGRFFHSFYEPLSVVGIAKPLGVGLGMGTNAASGIINDGKRVFLLVEGDTARVILESGPFIGLTYVLMRVVLMLYLGARAFRSLCQHANPLPMLIFSGIATVVVEGNFSQPTELGFATIAGGLCLAAINVGTAENELMAAPVEVPGPAAVPPARVIRGRSIYAERLHRPDPESTHD